MYLAPATREAHVGGSWPEAGLSKKCKTLSEKITKAKRTEMWLK
jgi:hypothetical protein